MRLSDITFLDAVIILSYFAGVFLLIHGWKRALRDDAKLILIGILALTALHDISNTLVFTRITEALDRYGDFVRVLIANLWGFFFYANIQGEIGRELKAAAEETERQNIALRKLDKIKDGLLRDVSHELKTPTAKIAMELELLKAKMAKLGMSEEAADLIAVMDKSVRRQERIIRNILDLSRLESGGRKYFIQAVPLHTLLAEVVEDYRTETETHGISLNLDLEEVEVQSDRSMLWHVFSNLIDNAIKFRNKKGRAVVEVTLEGVDGGALVTIRDNGIGIDPKELEHVFDTFYKVTPSTEGSGVGLNITRRIIQDLGGSISIESDGKGKGTAVRVRL